MGLGSGVFGVFLVVVLQVKFYIIMHKTALITGASSGIGWHMAAIHAERGGHLILVARREEKLRALKEQLEDQHNIEAHIIVQDLSESGAPEAVLDAVSQKNLKVDYLINNAGFGGLGHFHKRDWVREQNMIQVNITALVGLTRYFMTDMIAQNEGRILNVASTAAFMPGPLHAVYYASKAFVLSFSEAIANELANTDVSVTAFCPGKTDTEFQKMSGAKKTSSPSWVTHDARSVAQFGYNAMLKGKRIAIPGIINKITAQTPRMLPRAITTLLSRRAKDIH